MIIDEDNWDAQLHSHFSHGCFGYRGTVCTVLDSFDLLCNGLSIADKNG